MKIKGLRFCGMIEQTPYCLDETSTDCPANLMQSQLTLLTSASYERSQPTTLKEAEAAAPSKEVSSHLFPGLKLAPPASKVVTRSRCPFCEARC